MVIAGPVAVEIAVPNEYDTMTAEEARLRGARIVRE
jgi:hypothetical protein